MKINLAIGFLVLLIAGCTQFKQHTGEFQPYLCATLQNHGATLPISIPLYAGLPSRWETESDQKGIVILAPRKSFKAIDKMFRGLFGKPQLWAEKNLDGNRHGTYTGRNNACAIQYLEENNHTKIIILKKPKLAKQLSKTNL